MGPRWAEWRAKIKATIRETAVEAAFMDSVENKQWDVYNHMACNLGAGAPYQHEKGKSTKWPLDAYFCGHPDIDWSGAPWNGKPIVDLCHATVGDAFSKNVCGMYTDKEVVLGAMPGDLDTADDPRYINILTTDCIQDTVDGDIYYCQKCAGRCSGW